MQYLAGWSLLVQISVLCFFSLSIASLPSLANPISSPSFPIQPNLQIPPAPDTSSGNSAASIPPPLSKRGPVTHYRNLGVWRMILTASSLFSSPSTHLQTPATAITTFLTSVIYEAQLNNAKQAAESAIIEFGLGAISLAFRIRDGAGTSATVPWSLVTQLAQEFQRRAELGNPTSFRAVVEGPLGSSPLGMTPWIEVVLVVAGEKVMDGFPWSVY